jgi:Nucleotidyltransferase domain.
VGRAKSALLSQKLMLEGAVRFVEKAREKMNIVDVYVFGSRARGDYKDISDIDLVVVARGWISSVLLKGWRLYATSKSRTLNT